MTNPEIARTRLIVYLRQAGLSTARALANVDDFAHQLAEQIRQTPCTPGVDICACCSLAADRIDPKAQP